MDEFEIVSEVGKGTTVTVKEWMCGNHAPAEWKQP